MRNSFVSRLGLERSKNKKIFLLTGDLGFSVLESFEKKFQNSFINVGIAEQNMISIAAGLALEKFKVFTYSIVNFTTSRCHEQIKNDICYHNLDVTITAVGAGFPYGSQGYTHHGIEDITIMRVLPNMTIYNPADKFELEFCFNEIINNKSPKYLRLARGGEPLVHHRKITTKKKSIIVKKPGTTNILCSGTILKNCLDAANELIEENQNIGLISCPIISNKIEKYLIKILTKSKVIVTVEEHSKLGGFGSFIGEIINRNKLKCELIILGVETNNYSLIGSQEYLRNKNKIDTKSIIKILKSCYK